MSRILFNKTIFIFLILILFSSNYLKQNINNNKLNLGNMEILSGESNYINDVFDDDEDDYVTRDKNCNLTEYREQAERCDFSHMKCTDNKYLHHCSCKDGYITFPRNNTLYCNLKQKKQSIAFILEFCVGFGAGHFYRHEYTMGILKLVAFLLGIVFICIFPITAKCISDCDCDCCAVFISIIYYLYICGLAFWYIWDLVYFGKNKYKDLSYKDQVGKSIPLEHW